MELERKTKWTQGSFRVLRKILHSFLSLFRSSANTPVALNGATDLSISSVTVSTSSMSDNLDNSTPNTDASSIPSSIEELFSRIASDSEASELPSNQTESSQSSSLEELFDIDANVAPLSAGASNTAQSDESPEPLSLEELFEVRSQAQPAVSLHGELSGSELANDSNNVRTTNMILEDPWDEAIKESPMNGSESPMNGSEGKEAIAPYQESTPSDHNSDNTDSPHLDLSLEDEARGHPRTQYEPLEPDDTLLSRASQGDLDAFRQLLNNELAPHHATIMDMESRQDLLQISLSGERVPVQTVIEPLIKTWVLNVGFVKVQKIELYGQRDGSELPYWRSEFNPSELEYIIQPQDLGFELTDVPPEDFSFVEVDTVETPSEVNSAPIDNEPLNIYSQESGSNILDNPSVSDFDVDTPLESVDDIPLESNEPLNIYSQESGSNVLDNPSVSNFDVDTPLKAVDDIPLESIDNSPILSPVAFLSTDVLAEMPSSSSSFVTSVVEDADFILGRRKLVESFLAQYAAGERAFIKIDLSETDLSGINLTLADLQDALLIWANLQDASLYHVNLSGAKLRHANLNGAKLRSANLQGADFLNADLSHADLSWSNLRGANLTGANLADANLKNAILENVIMPDGTLLD
jgi:Pentapeptide repeats (8 copies)